jgi:hypothetical protein
MKRSEKSELAKINKLSKKAKDDKTVLMIVALGAFFAITYSVIWLAWRNFQF